MGNRVSRAFVALVAHMAPVLLLWCGRCPVAARSEVELSWQLCKADILTTTGTGAARSVPVEQQLHEQGVRLSAPSTSPHSRERFSGCIDAVVPGTILANLIRNGTFGAGFDPFFETNLASIPDINNTGPEAWLFFYVAEFEFDLEEEGEVPATGEDAEAAAATAGTDAAHAEQAVHALLQLRSVNYRAQVWFDGHAVVPPPVPAPVPGRPKHDRGGGGRSSSSNTNDTADASGAKGGGCDNFFFPGAPRPEETQGMFQRFLFPLGEADAGACAGADGGASAGVSARGASPTAYAHSSARPAGSAGPPPPSTGPTGPTGGRHGLAVLVHPPPNPGSCDGGQGGSHDLAKDGPVSQCAAGWDWVQGTPDRNTGLWDRATLRLTGAVQLRDPTVRATNIDVQRRTATLHISATLDNRDLDQDRCVVVGATIFAPDVVAVAAAGDAGDGVVGGGGDGSKSSSCNTSSGSSSCTNNTQRSDVVDTQEFEHVVEARLAAGASGAVVVFPPVSLEDAQLWWPHTHGDPALYEAHIVVTSWPCNASNRDSRGGDAAKADVPTRPATPDSEAGARLARTVGAMDDDATFPFGVRLVQPLVTQSGDGDDTPLPKRPAGLGGLEFRINGVRVFLNGGNWIMSDQLLRFAGDPQRAEAEVGMHRAMGLNLIRVWGGGITERPEFYDACDRLGVLVFQEFWMTGDNNGRWAGSYSWPLNHARYVAAVRDTLLLLRNHPSLLFYDAGNELYPTARNPPPALLVGMHEALREVAPDTFFIVSSMTNATDFDPTVSLAPRDGPYTIMAEELFYERNPNMWDWRGHRVVRFDEQPMPFQPEIGSVSHPVYRSLLNFMLPASAAAFPGRGDAGVHPTWEYHKFIGFTPVNRTPAGTPVPEHLVVDHVFQYGAPSNTSEYCLRAQFAQFAQYRALFESYQARMWEWYSAAVFWKSQGPWPALRGALYDWYLAPTGGFYGVRAALAGAGSRWRTTGTGSAGAGSIAGASAGGGVGSAGAGPSASSKRVHAQLDLKNHSLVVVAAAGANDFAAGVCVLVRAFELAGSASGTLLWSRGFAVTPVANAATRVANGTVPWAAASHGAAGAKGGHSGSSGTDSGGGSVVGGVGGAAYPQVLLYRVEAWAGGGGGGSGGGSGTRSAGSSRPVPTPALCSALAAAASAKPLGAVAGWPARRSADQVRSASAKTTATATAAHGLAEQLASGTPLSLADYWLSDWTAVPAKAQNYTALGAWRDDTAHHVTLQASVKWCAGGLSPRGGGGVGDGGAPGWPASAGVANTASCAAAGCSSGDLLLQVDNGGSSALDAAGTEMGATGTAVAFGVVAELHFASTPGQGDRRGGPGTAKNGGKDETEGDNDTRVLPTFCSDGMFSLLPGEGRGVCVAPGPGARAQGRALEVRVSGWNVRPQTLAVPTPQP